MYFLASALQTSLSIALPPADQQTPGDIENRAGRMHTIHSSSPSGIDLDQPFRDPSDVYDVGLAAMTVAQAKRSPPIVTLVVAAC